MFQRVYYTNFDVLTYLSPHYIITMIKFGLVGCGSIGERHAKHITDNSEAELVAVYDIKTERKEALEKKYNILPTASIAEMVNRKEIDVITVCTPNGNHFSTALLSLEAGKNVLIEKPMTINKLDAERLIYSGLKNNKQIFVVKQNRFNPPVQHLKQLMQREQLGKIYFVVIDCFWNRNKEYYLNSDWKGKKNDDGGTLFTQFSHFIDIPYYLFGDIDLDSITGVIKNAGHDGLIEFEDTGAFTFKFKSGALGSLNYTTASFKQNMEGSITVFAENATIKIGGQYLNTLEYQKTNGFDNFDLPESKPANDYGFYQGSMSNHDKIISNVVDALLGKGQIMTNAVEGMKVVEIIERMYNVAKVIS